MRPLVIALLLTAASIAQERPLPDFNTFAAQVKKHLDRKSTRLNSSQLLTTEAFFRSGSPFPFYRLPFALCRLPFAVCRDLGSGAPGNRLNNHLCALWLSLSFSPQLPLRKSGPFPTSTPLRRR